MRHRSPAGRLAAARRSPIHNICSILTSIQSLLTDPNCASPANPEAAHVFTHDRKQYNRFVKACCARQGFVLGGKDVQQGLTGRVRRGWTACMSDLASESLLGAS